MHLSLRPKAWAGMWRIWLAPSLGGLSCYPLCINVVSVSETSTLFACTVLNDYAVFSQRWRSQYVSVICSFLTTFVLPLKSDEAVSVCARNLLCSLTTLVLSDKPVCVCARYLLCSLTTLVLSDKPVSVCARYLLCPLTTLVLSDKLVSACARYLLCPLTMLVLSDKPVCMCTLSAVLSQRWCCQKNQSQSDIWAMIQFCKWY